MTVRRKGRIRFTATAAIGLAVSQICGFWINASLRPLESTPLLPFLHLTHIRNHGGIFGLMQGKGWAFAILAAGLIAGLIFYVWRSRHVRPIEYGLYGLIVAGGLSNILDRFLYGSVIDYIDIRGVPFWHYIFNVADCLIHLGVWPLILIHFIPEKPDEAVEPTA